jgi:hypothetical protein
MFVDDATTVSKGQPNFLQPRPRENDGFWRVGRNFLARRRGGFSLGWPTVVM